MKKIITILALFIVSTAALFSQADNTIPKGTIKSQ